MVSSTEEGSTLSVGVTLATELALTTLESALPLGAALAVISDTALLLTASLGSALALAVTVGAALLTALPAVTVTVTVVASTAPQEAKPLPPW